LPAGLSQAAHKHATGPHRHLIGGARSSSADGRTFTTFDPSTGRAIAAVSQAGTEEVDRAVRAARAAFEAAWGSLTAPARSSLIYALADLVEENAGELAELEALDNGKPVRLARAVDVRL